jgi:hypothetical protein
MGNHERKHVRASRHEVKLTRSQQISKIQFGVTYPDAIAFMDDLPISLDLPEAILTHGYFEPGIPCEQQKPSVLCGTMGGERHLQTTYNRPWYELYDVGKPIVVGHKNYTNTDQPFIYQDRVFGLDTSCVTGKSLTGLLLPDFRFVSVPSRGNHWMHVSRKYPKPEKRIRPRPVPAAWTKTEEGALISLIENICRVSETILRDLQSNPAYADLPLREQVRLFGDAVGKGNLATLLQLARVGKLDVALAHKILKTSDELRAVIDKVQ